MGPRKTRVLRAASDLFEEVEGAIESAVDGCSIYLDGASFEEAEGGDDHSKRGVYSPRSFSFARNNNLTCLLGFDKYDP